MKRLFIISLLFVNLNFASANPFTITNDVDLVLKDMQYSGRHEFEVSVKGNTVTVDGFVSTADDRARVERAVRSVNGVSVVVNNLKLVGASAISTSNTGKIIRDRIKADPSIKNYTLDIEHLGNNITLTGEVDLPADKSKIFNIAYNVAPDANIQNDLKVKNQASASDFDVNEKVMAALKTEGVKGLETVVVETNEGIVKFSGQVKNHRDIDQMLSIALMIEGVKSVRSEVKVAN